MSNQNPLKITIDGKQGLFTGEGINPTGELVVVILRIDKGREFYGAKHVQGQESKSFCTSVDGVKPFKPFIDAAGHHSGGLSATCASCAQNRLDTPAAHKCRSLWSLIVLLDSEEVRRLAFSLNSQSALEQNIVSLESEIKRITLEENASARLCDFAVSFRLEKRKTARLFSLAYPLPYAGSLTRIPFVNGLSRHDSLFNDYQRPVTVSSAPECVSVSDSLSSVTDNEIVQI